MSASRENLARAVRESAAQIEEMARALDGEALAGGVYENGWNARQLLCHLANGGWFAGFMIGLARAGRSLEPPADFDQDEWNARDVPAHQDKTNRGAAGSTAYGNGAVAGHDRGDAGRGASAAGGGLVGSREDAGGRDHRCDR